MTDEHRGSSGTFTFNEKKIRGKNERRAPRVGFLLQKGRSQE